MHNSVTGADILESSLTKVGAAVHADSATTASHADTAASAANAAHADSATHADNANQLGGIAAAQWQKRVTGSCAGTLTIKSIAADGSVTCVSPIVKLSFIVPNGQTADPTGPFADFHIGVGCNVGPLGTTFVAFVNTGPSAGTLNWIYSNGASVSADGRALAAGNGEWDIGFQDARIEGQFTFSNAAGVETINLHAFDGEGAGCELRGTAEGS